MSVPKSAVGEAREYRLEVETKYCDRKYRQTGVIPNASNIEVNIKINCEISDGNSNTQNRIGELPQQWEGTYTQILPSPGKFPMILYIESIENGIVRGKINWSSVGNTITGFEGEIVDRPSNSFVEEMKWKFTDEQLRSTNGIWLKFIENEHIAGGGVWMNGQYYCFISNDGLLIGTGFLENDSAKAGTYRLIKK